ncbi:plasmid partitioning protein RepB [Rhizobium sp. BK376]|jgi:ParB family chromosome partitioning protein|uniref:plasmid partitioning protein RepB n=1 Tax=Rhizobium sp. BK376 TaxID=2512149 RepID=UPI00104EB825|nr:plasmid partitioning protein RepB [Rhizobium sp. BK376]TCR80857.1 ParB family chromosome partitioning protein [Rhizobium sp. BK376]
MARRDVLLGITQADAKSGRPVANGYASRGASRSMISSLSELAEKAALVDQLQGETVVELDPDLVDASFVSDRMEGDDQAFEELVAAIRERGQDTPVLVRPHPSLVGRYQLVFGHRRVRAAKLLAKPVRAIVKQIDDIGHVIAQGQENSARENLSFIERAAFADRLVGLGYDRAIVQVALAIDAPMLTRMLSVTSRVPAEVIAAIGPAKSVGRDRWIDLAQLLERPSNSEKAMAFIGEAAFRSAGADVRFDALVKQLKAAPKRTATAGSAWEAGDKALAAQFKPSGKTYTVALKAKNAGKFGRYLADNIDRLYEEFRRDTENN